MDQDGLSLSQVLGNPTAPNGEDFARANPEMLGYLNDQVSKGLSDDDAISATAAKYPEAQGVRFIRPKGSATFVDAGAPAEGLSLSEVLAQPAGPTSKGPLQNTPILPDSKGTMLAKSIATGLQEGVLTPFQRLQTSMSDWLQHPERLASQDAGKVTPEQKEAAKLIGADIGNDWGSILKLTPQQLAEGQDKALSAAGFSPEEIKKRDEAVAKGEVYSGPIEGLLQHSAVKDLLSGVYNPNESNTLLYHKVNEVAHLMDVVKHPEQYDKEDVKAAQEQIDEYKEQGKKGTWENLKDSLKQMKEHPLSLVNTTLADLELLLAPEARIGTAGLDAKIATMSQASTKAARYEKLARSVAKSAAASPDVAAAASEQAAHYSRVAERIQGELSKTQAGRKALDIASGAASGAAANAAISGVQQTGEQGYVQKGTLGPAMTLGAVLGGTLTALGGEGHAKPGEMESRVDEARTREVDASQVDQQPNINANRKPGEPLSPDTPINKDQHIPYYGGVDKEGRVIHLDENTPDTKDVKNRDGETKTIPVKKTVAYHEQVEYPLMHMEGPIQPETLADLRNRMSPEDWKKIPPEVIKKLKEGKSLTYPEAHTYFATAAENHLVSSLYNVDPKVYQESLKPHIKDIAEANKTADASDIPSNLDSKPYDDMGGTSSLKGEGERPSVDGVEPGSEKHSDNRAKGQKGIIDKRLIATGATTAAGAGLGAALSPDDQRGAGAIAGGAAGLLLGSLHGGGDIGAKGLGKKEGGMFTGPLSKTYSGVEERLATRMEEMGKTPEQIHLATGMSKEASGRWVKEISDKGMEMLPRNHPNWERATKEAIPMSTLVNHAELDKAYPGLMDQLKIKVNPELSAAGSYNPKTKTLTLGNLDTLDKLAQKRPSMAPRSVIAHELQHAIQDVEGLPGGTSVAREEANLANAKEYLETRQENLYDKWMEAVGKDDTANIDKYDKELRKVAEQIDTLPSKAKANYAMEAGETQARNVQTRLDYDEATRAAKSPRESEDVPLKNQRVNKESGQVDPELLKKLGKTAALGTLGATLGAAYLDPENKVKGAWAGAGLALVGGEVNWRKLFPSIKDIIAKDPRFNVNNVLDNWDHARAASQRTTMQAQMKVLDLVKDPKSLAKITHWLDGDKSIPLTDKEYAAAKVAREFYDSLGKAALNTGVLRDFLQDYVNHEWGDNAAAKKLQDDIEAAFPTNMSPKDRHALARKFLTLEQGKAAGLTPKTENIAELMGIYANSMSRAMANKTLLDALKVKTLDPRGDIKAAMPAGKAPYNYVPINHPQLANVRVHPSIAPSLDFLFHMRGGKGAVQALESANTAVKRMQVSFSMFHVKALLDAYFGANPLTNTFRNMVDAASSAGGKSKFHEMYASGGPGDVVDELLAGGLKVDPKKGEISSEDVRNGFYEALDSITKIMDNMVPGLGKIPGAIKAANKLSDRFIWENVHTGLKGMTAMNAYERMQRAWAKEAARNPNVHIPSNAEIAKAAASFTNDTFGGLNWRRIADDANTKWGRALGLAFASPAGRRLSQVMLFAPDWTFSTIRSFFKAIGQGSGVKGLLQPKYLADLHRQYIVRSAFIYLTMYNALNQALSGHPIWENKDPLTVDMGNGERLQANKHFLEVPHMLMNPAKFWMGKLGTIPSEALDQIFGKEYLTPSGGPPMKGGRLEHAASRVLPFSLGGNEYQGTPEKIMSALGIPVYGAPTGTKEYKEVKAAEKKERQKHRKTGSKKTKHEFGE